MGTGSKSEIKASTESVSQPTSKLEAPSIPSSDPTPHDGRQPPLGADASAATEASIFNASSERETAMERLRKFARTAKPLTLPSVEVLQLARIWESRYARWDTETLEARYFQWKQQKRKHDCFCLICVEVEPDHKCDTCQRAYHKNCLHTRFHKKASATPTSASTRASTSPTWYCPLCKKRTWSNLLPKDALTRRMVVEKDERGLLLQRKFKKEPAFALTLTWTDNGTRESDLKLLYQLKAIDGSGLQNALYVDKDFVSNHKMQSAGAEAIADGESTKLQLKAEEMEKEIKVLRQFQRLDKERQDVLGEERKHKPAGGRAHCACCTDEEDCSDFDEEDEAYGRQYPFF